MVRIMKNKFLLCLSALLMVSTVAHAEKLSKNEIYARVDNLKVDTAHCDMDYLAWLNYQVMQSQNISSKQLNELSKQIRQFKIKKCQPAGYYKKGHKNYIDRRKRIKERIDYLTIE